MIERKRRKNIERIAKEREGNAGSHTCITLCLQIECKKIRPNWQRTVNGAMPLLKTAKLRRRKIYACGFLIFFCVTLQSMCYVRWLFAPGILLTLVRHCRVRKNSACFIEKFCEKVWSEYCYSYESICEYLIIAEILLFAWTSGENVRFTVIIRGS